MQRACTLMTKRTKTSETKRNEAKIHVVKSKKRKSEVCCSVSRRESELSVSRVVITQLQRSFFPRNDFLLHTDSILPADGSTVYWSTPNSNMQPSDRIVIRSEPAQVRTDTRVVLLGIVSDWFGSYRLRVDVTIKSKSVRKTTIYEHLLTQFGSGC